MSRQRHTDPLHPMVGVAHLAERSVVVREATGSNPVTHPTFGLRFT